jgi:hypothetical protein
LGTTFFWNPLINVPLGIFFRWYPRRLLGARRSLVGINDLGRNYETWDDNQLDLKIMSFNLNVKMKEKWFQLPLSGYVQRVGFYTFLIHSSTLSEVVFCTTSAYPSPLYQSLRTRAESEW